MEVNITKTKIMVKQKKPKCQEKRHIFTLGNKTIEYLDSNTKTQNKLHCYRGLNRKYKMAAYLYTVKDIKQTQLLTKYRMTTSE